MKENAKSEIRAESFDFVKSQIIRSTGAATSFPGSLFFPSLEREEKRDPGSKVVRAVPNTVPLWNSGRDASVSTSCLFSINLFGGLILFQMHFFLKYNKSILCSYSGFLM